MQLGPSGHTEDISGSIFVGDQKVAALLSNDRLPRPTLAVDRVGVYGEPVGSPGVQVDLGDDVDQPGTGGRRGDWAAPSAKGRTPRGPGYLDGEAAGEAVERGVGAARDLPRAERLSRLLYEHAERVAKEYDLDAEDEVVEDYFTIERVQPGGLWLTGGIGPVNVDTTASSLARPGWPVYLVLSRSHRGWEVLEAGNVYA